MTTASQVHGLPLVWSASSDALLRDVDRHVLALKIQRWTMHAMIGLKNIDPNGSVFFLFDGANQGTFFENASVEVKISDSTFSSDSFRDMPKHVENWFLDLGEGWPQEFGSYAIAQTAFGGNDQGWMTLDDWEKRLPYTLPDHLLAQYRHQRLAQQWEDQPVSPPRPRPRA